MNNTQPKRQEPKLSNKTQVSGKYMGYGRSYNPRSLLTKKKAAPVVAETTGTSAASVGGGGSQGRRCLRGLILFMRPDRPTTKMT